MAGKPVVSFKSGCDTIPDCLGISEKRAQDLIFRGQEILHNFFKPTKDDFLPPTDDILKMYIALAENNQELVFCSFLAGAEILQVNNHFNYMEDEE